VGLAARGRRADLGGLLDADDHPADRARHARDGRLPRLPARFKDVHPVYKTPSFSTIVGGTVAICYYLGMTLISDNILQDSISSLGLAIAFYYAITGYACVWYFRRDLATRARAVGQGHLPAARRPHADLRLRAVGHRHVRRRLRQHGAARHRRHLRRRHRALLVGVVLMFVWYLFPRSKPFFQGAL
jgi:hypothetical protein